MSQRTIAQLHNWTKGGVRNSTICIMLAGAFTANGARVHIIDLDEHQTVQRWHTQHGGPIEKLSVSAVPPAQFPEHLKEITGHAAAPDLVLVDVAGGYEKALLQAMGRSHLVIVPAQPSEPDIHEATKVIRDLTNLNDNFGSTVPYRLLLNLFEPFDPDDQRHSVAEIASLKLNRFDAVLHAPDREAILTGVTPHYGAGKGPAVKAVAELNGLVADGLADALAVCFVRRHTRVPASVKQSQLVDSHCLGLVANWRESS